MKRRTFLKTLGIGAGAFMAHNYLRPRRAFAAADRSFVFCYFRGGWDTLLSLDPRDPNVFTEARREETRIELAWDQLPAGYPRTILQPSGSNIQFGPVMEAMAPHYEKMCVARGLSMNTVAHDVGRRYFITGQTPRGNTAAGSAVPTRIVAQQGDQSPFPNLVMGAETYNDGLPAFASGLTVNSVTDLVTSLTVGPGAPPAAVRDRIAAYRDGKPLCDPVGHDRRGLLTRLGDSQIKARELVESGLSSKFAFANANDSEMTALRSRYGIQNIDGVPAQAAAAFQALKYELTQVITIDATQNLDTHDGNWATDQPDNQAEGWTALAQLITDLESEPDPTRGGTLLDNTTILCFSEFSRTPLLNNRGGRDHHLATSCALIGAGVPGNRVVGATSDVGMTPMAIDPNTGAVQDGGTIITPTLVIASLMQAAGYDVTALRTDGLPCLMA
ncbi:MAG: DUF1501 domain-containing protein [Deltaproteobacteria bacterium]|jgi:uncharacterized protein (DUF1501 family)